MFDHNEDDQQATDQPVQDAPSMAPVYDSGGVVVPEPVISSDNQPEPVAAPVEEPALMAQSAPAVQDDDSFAPVEEPAEYPSPVVTPIDSPTEDAFSPAPSTDEANGAIDLLGLKQKALQELSPLVGHLEQTPEEKFRTAMMMIQASDNKDLLPDAYKAAQAITDDKVKAQALLDVINEINYFTQNNS